MATSVHRTARSIADFQREFFTDINFLLADACVPFEFDFPPLAEVVDILRRSDDTSINLGEGHNYKQRQANLNNMRDHVRQAPVDEVLRLPITLSNFNLKPFDTPGGFLHGLGDQVIQPWKAFLAQAGFTFDRCYPIIFISGPGANSSYHVDGSDVVAWQIHGTKHFHGLRDPQRHEPAARLANDPASRSSIVMPEPLAAEDVVTYAMDPGDVLFNHLLTPHWVEAAIDQGAMSLNISHGGLRCHGQLNRRGELFEARLAAHPNERMSKSY